MGPDLYVRACERVCVCVCVCVCVRVRVCNSASVGGKRVMPTLDLNPMGGRCEALQGPAR